MCIYHAENFHRSIYNWELGLLTVILRGQSLEQRPLRTVEKLKKKNTYYYSYNVSLYLSYYLQRVLIFPLKPITMTCCLMITSRNQFNFLDLSKLNFCSLLYANISKAFIKQSRCCHFVKCTCDIISHSYIITYLLLVLFSNWLATFQGWLRIWQRSAKCKPIKNYTKKPRKHNII